MQSPERKVRKPRYGMYAWPYFVLVTFLGILGMALILAGIAEGGFMLLSGVVLATVGVYLALGHYFMIRVHEKKENVFAQELLRLIEPVGNSMILDIGSGTGRTAITIAKNSACSKVVGIDIYSRKMIYANSPRRA